MKKLSLLLAKHKVSLDDILGDAIKTYDFRFRDSLDEDLMVQLYYSITKERDRKVWTYSRGGRKVSKKIGLDMTTEQYVDFQERLPYYRSIWKKELKRLFSAFCHKHNLLRPADPNATRSFPNEQEIQEYLRMKQMMRGLGEKAFFKPTALLAG